MTRWITTTEAARRLGVKRGTLYSYVSRGVLTSQRQPGRDESLFDLTQVENLAASKHDGRRASESLLKFRAVSSSVSSLSQNSLMLRGVEIETLCTTMTFSEVVRFVLQVSDQGSGIGINAIGTTDLQRYPIHRRIPLAVAHLAAGPVPQEQMAPEEQIAPEEQVATEGQVARMVAALVDYLPTLIGEIDTADPLVQSILICMIDNGLAVSATAARVAASARAGIYQCLLAGYAALSGALHGGAVSAAYNVIADVKAGQLVTGPQVARRGGFAPGLGHVIYNGVDPRARLLLGALERRFPHAEEMRIVARHSESVNLPPNIDAAVACALHIFGYPVHAGEALYQVGRSVGIGAQVIEEYREDPLRWRGANT